MQAYPQSSRRLLIILRSSLVQKAIEHPKFLRFVTRLERRAGHNLDLFLLACAWAEYMRPDPYLLRQNIVQQWGLRLGMYIPIAPARDLPVRLQFAS